MVTIPPVVFGLPGKNVAPYGSFLMPSDTRDVRVKHAPHTGGGEDAHPASDDGSRAASGRWIERQAFDVRSLGDDGGGLTVVPERQRPRHQGG